MKREVWAEFNVVRNADGRGAYSVHVWPSSYDHSPTSTLATSVGASPVTKGGLEFNTVRHVDGEGL